MLGSIVIHDIYCIFVLYLETVLIKLRSDYVNKSSVLNNKFDDPILNQHEKLN